MLGDATAGGGLSSPEVLEALFSGFADFDAIGLAVSGGPDSVAMMHLAHAWRDRRLGGGASVPELVVLTVDHGLREGSAAEACAVGRWAAGLGLSHEIIRWQGSKPSTGVQEAARAARYDLLTAWAMRYRSDGRVALALAHHVEDQAETVLMRLARGSGPDGLAAMRGRSSRDEVVVLRPLLGLTKADLVGHLETIGAEWFEDPSNQSLLFERVRLRAERASRERMGLSDHALALAARRAGRAADALEWATDAFVASMMANQPLLELGGVVWPREASVPQDIAIRGLARVLAVCGGTRSGEVELAAVERLAARIACGNLPGATLGRCQIKPLPIGLVIYREVHRCDLPWLTLQPDETRVWDGRFEVSAVGDGASPDGPVTVRGWDEAADRAAGLVDAKPGAAVALAADGKALRGGQPVFWCGNRIVGMPTVHGGPLPGVQSEGQAPRFTATFLSSRLIDRD
jgi:tRNA(Ile)-lysidine synthase